MTTTPISTILWIIWRIFRTRIFSASSRTATFISPPATARGKTAGLRTGYRRFWRIKEFDIRSTIGDRKAAMIGHSGSIKCGNTSQDYSEGTLREPQTPVASAGICTGGGGLHPRNPPLHPRCEATEWRGFSPAVKPLGNEGL